nr:hypothetical protein Iba_chr08eCG2260 [Ipomoea batatas]
MINCLRTKQGNVWRRDWLTATTTIFIESRTWTRITWREFVNLAQNLPVLVRDYWSERIVEGHYEYFKCSIIIDGIWTSKTVKVTMTGETVKKAGRDIEPIKGEQLIGQRKRNHN